MENKTELDTQLERESTPKNEIDPILEKDIRDDEDITKEIKSIESDAVQKKNTKKLVKALIITGIMGILLIIIAILVFVFKLDGLLLPSSVSGTIMDYASRPLEGAKVCVHTSCTTTDNNGVFSIYNLVYGKFELSIEHDNFFPFKEEIFLVRGQELKFNKELSAKGMGELKGLIKTKDGNDINIEGLQVLVDDRVITHNTDATFTHKGLPKGKYTLTVKTPEYLDYKSEINIESGMNDLGVILLDPAMDIYFTTVDWFTNQVIANAGVKAGEMEYWSDLDGKFIIQDLVVSSEYTLTIDKEEYNQKKVELKNLKQGKNIVEDQKMTIKGRVLFISNRTGNQNIYSVDFDGSNETTLTSNSGQNYELIYSKDFKTAYYLSTQDGVKNSYGSIIPLPYSINVTNGSTYKLAKTNYSDYGSLGSYNYTSMKRTFVKYMDMGKNEFYYGNLDGGNTKLIGFLQGGYAGSPAVSNDGKYILFTWSDYYTTDNSGIYYLSTENNQLKKVLTTKQSSAAVRSISNDSQKAIAEVYDNTSQKWDIWAINVSNGSSTRLTNSTTQEVNAIYSPDNRHILYMSNRDGSTNLFRLDANGTNEMMLTKTGKVTSFIAGPNNTILFVNENSLWIADINQSFEPRKIKDNVSAYNFADYYYFWD